LSGIWAALPDQTQDAIIVRDLEDRIVFWNARAGQLYGWQQEEVLGQNLYELLFPGKSAVVRQASLGLAQNDEWAGEITQPTKAGPEITVQSRWKLLRDEAGAPQGVLIINTDVTEQRRLESLLLREQRIEMTGTLAVGLAHDLNNVLSPVLLAVHTLRRKFADEDSQRWLSILEGRAEQGSRMIAQVLMLTKESEAERSPVQLRHLMSEIRKTVIPALLKSVEVEVTFNADLWPVAGNVTELHQLLLSLCLQAGSLLAGGGAISFRADNVQKSASFVPVPLKPGNCVRINVTIDGAAWPEQLADSPAFRAVAAIVRNHRGLLEVQREAERSTRLSIWLPAWTAEPAARTTAPASNPPGRSELVLVVHNDELVREIISATLKASGYRVMTAADDATAQALLAEHRNQVRGMLLRLNRGQAGCLAVVSRLRELRPELKIILVCGSDDLRIHPKISDQTGLAVLTEPFTAASLLSALAGVLSGAAPVG
jgi:PAS domain S-box-containing protein